MFKSDAKENMMEDLPKEIFLITGITFWLEVSVNILSLINLQYRPEHENGD